MKALAIAVFMMALVTLCGDQALAQSVTVTGGSASATFSAVVTGLAPAGGAQPAPQGTVIFDFFVDTVADILVFDAEIVDTAGANVPGGWFNVTNGLGQDNNPPNPALLAAFPELAADAFVTTPSFTTSAFGSLDGPPGQKLVTLFDATDDGPQTDFNFARFALIPDANGDASATFRGNLQTAPQANMPPVPLFDDFEFFFSLDGVVNANFEDGVPSLSGSPNSVDEFFLTNQSNLNIQSSNDPEQFPNGVTMFVPTDAARLAWEVENGQPDINIMLVADDGDTTGASDSGDSGWDVNDLTNLVPNPGDSITLLPFSGQEVALSNGSVMYGGGTIIESRKVSNGWIHVLDAVPTVPTVPIVFPCDADSDGDCENDDLVALYAAAGTSGALDLDGSGTVDAGDVAVWLDEASVATNPAKTIIEHVYKLGDLDLNGQVNNVDLGVLLNNYDENGPNAVGFSGGDLNMDSNVDNVDLGQLLNEFGHASLAAVPEPESPTLLLSLILVLLARRRSN